MKKWAKKGHKPTFPSFKALQWLYLVTLDGRELPADVQEANAYLMPLLKKEIKNQSLYEKALTAIILSKTEPKLAAEYVQSLKEYTVYREDMGRYYDTPRAGYSWFDYKIPTQTVAIEAMQRLTPADTETITEMQCWLLQSKRTQAWDTPINSVNAVYAFLQGSNALAPQELSVLKVDEQPLDLPKATAAIGYVKTNVPAESKSRRARPGVLSMPSSCSPRSLSRHQPPVSPSPANLYLLPDLRLVSLSNLRLVSLPNLRLLSLSKQRWVIA